MTDAALLAALRASVGNPDALESLALVELWLSQASTSRSRDELTNLLDRWADALIGIGADDVRRLKVQLQEACDLALHSSARDHDERGVPDN
jgi:hypothetical protein